MLEKAEKKERSQVMPAALPASGERVGVRGERWRGPSLPLTRSLAAPTSPRRRGEVILRRQPYLMRSAQRPIVYFAN
jgi:hypothetical protein